EPGLGRDFHVEKQILCLFVIIIKFYCQPASDKRGFQSDIQLVCGFPLQVRTGRTAVSHTSLLYAVEKSIEGIQQGKRTVCSDGLTSGSPITGPQFQVIKYIHIPDPGLLYQPPRCSK